MVQINPGPPRRQTTQNDHTSIDFPIFFQLSFKNVYGFSNGGEKDTPSQKSGELVTWIKRACGCIEGFLNLPLLHPGMGESPIATGLYGAKGGEKEHWGAVELRKATFTQKNCGFYWGHSHLIYHHPLFIPLFYVHPPNTAPLVSLLREGEEASTLLWALFPAKYHASSCIYIFNSQNNAEMRGVRPFLKTEGL